MSEEYLAGEEPQRIVSDIGQWAMSPAWVRKALRGENGRIDAMALAVFCVLAEKADHGSSKWEDFRSVKTIADELGVDPGTVRRSLQHLKEIGAVDWTQRTRPDGSKSTNDYKVFFADPARVDASTTARERAHHNVRASARDGTARERADSSHTFVSHTSNQTPTLVIDGVDPDAPPIEPAPRSVAKAEVDKARQYLKPKPLGTVTELRKGIA